jgi:signal peptidase I
MTAESSSRVGRILAYVVSALTLAIVAANLFGLISLRVVQTTSMQGTIEVGDLVVSQNWLKPSVGDIAVYKATDFQGVAQAMVVHRVIAGDEAGGYTFQGDNNQSADPQVIPASDVVGVVSFWVPGIGQIANPFVLAVLVSLGAVIYFARENIAALGKKFAAWLGGQQKRPRRLYLAALSIIAAWLVIAGAGIAGFARFEHPQVGPQLAIGSSTQSIVVVLPNANASVGGLALANIAGKRSLVRIDAVEGSTYTVSSTVGKLLIPRKDIDGPITFVIPFLGALWLPFD